MYALLQIWQPFTAEVVTVAGNDRSEGMAQS